MIISDTSPFKHIPADLNQQQASFFDGIRYAIEMADLASTRLAESLWSLSTACPGTTLDPIAVTSSFLDSWSMVDSIHRLRELLEQMPGLKKRSQSSLYRRFRQETAVVKDIRNTVQHLRGEIHEMANNGWPVWGTLAWLALLDPDAGRCRCCTMTSGRTMSGTQMIVNPCGKAIHGRIDLVTLQCKSHRLDLSETIRLTEQVIRLLEKPLLEQFDGLPTCGSEIVAHVDMVVPMQPISLEGHVEPTQSHVLPAEETDCQRKKEISPIIDPGAGGTDGFPE